MDEIVQQFISTGAVILALACYIVTWFIRRAVETARPSLAKKADENHKDATYETPFARWWNKFILYLIPVVTGALSGLIDMPFIFGEDLKTTAARCLFGSVIGWFSGMLYKGLRMGFAKKLGVDPKDLTPNGND